MRSHLNDMAPILNICIKETMNSLNMAARVVGVGMMDPISHMHKELKIPTRQEMNIIYVGKFMHCLFIKDLKGSFDFFGKKVGRG